MERPPHDAERSLQRALASLRRTAAAIGDGPGLGDPDALAHDLAEHELRVRLALEDLMAGTDGPSERDPLADVLAGVRAEAGTTGVRLSIVPGLGARLPAAAVACVGRLLSLAIDEATPEGEVALDADRAPGMALIAARVQRPGPRRSEVPLRLRLATLRHAAHELGGRLRRTDSDGGALLRLHLPVL